MKLVELHTKADQLSGSYYLGYLVYQSADAATLISLDDDANAGGVLVINNQDILTSVDESPSLAYCQHLIDEGKSTDPFALMPLNQELLKTPLTSLSAASQAALEKDLVVNITLTSGIVYTGIIALAGPTEIQLKQIGDDYELDPLCLVIPLSAISSLELNAPLNKLWKKYQVVKEQFAGQNPYGLVELYLDWLDDARFGSCLLGLVLDQSDQFLLFESLNDYGQLESICLVNREDVVHESVNSAAIDFSSFLVAYNQKNEIFDPGHLGKLAQSLDHVPTVREVIEKAGKQLVSVDDYELAGENLGYVTAVDEAGFTIEDPESGQEVSHLFENVCALDLASTELEKMREFLAAQNQ
ncbi:hypothetical protein [Lactobacillus delbrueckii]|uniref:hypothetical protein n=1 Tax=Lactobacillus delbrueckii TaxID=1584 RepID=UPI00067FF026|nr:hypothetical protein [Lactobacillus delbrueckii]APG75286.1 hypothetical protein LS838_08405 [Lactobacillus delbrueckii subsp. sunkii]KNE73614.1 hypothetical protein LDS38_08475 [Lactobacillus delbrueckii subsp. sunkii]GHN12967.1 hypothetical protein NRIC0766_10980 [Lactobacillus delbrueckii subsp. sunkii]GHN13911.1 hypothetical protein NRIC0767_01720 [Lactobacillus delbrueckii subsp. sunkii]